VDPTALPIGPGALEPISLLVRHTENHQGRASGHLHCKGASDRPSCIEQEARRIKQGAHGYLRREAAARRDPRREADILVATLYKHQASD
jgi:hypothetical protein